MLRVKTKKGLAPFIENSTCLVLAKTIEGQLYSLKIDFTGELSNFPNVSNSKFVVNGRIIHNPANINKLKAMIRLYTNAVMAAKIFPPTFLDTKVHVLACLSKTMYRQDSHNACKCIGDFLEDIQVINNDRTAEIQTIRKTDYPSLFNEQELETTSLYIQPQAQVSTIITEAAYGIIQKTQSNKYLGFEGIPSGQK